MSPTNWAIRYGTWAVVTGASDGIGRAIALEIAKRGVNVVLVARRKSMLNQLAGELQTQYRIQTRVIEADLTHASAVQTVLEETQELAVGLLVACAGFGTTGPLIEAKLEHELSMLEVNCQAVLLLSQGFGKRFAQQGHGGLILMSSLVAFQGVPMSAHYAATKAYVQSLAEGLYFELAPFGVDVLASAPGPVQSGFAARADMQMSMALKPEAVAQATLNALGRQMTVRPGWLSKLLEGSLSPLPRSMRVRIMQRVMQSMTQHQLKQAKERVL